MALFRFRAYWSLSAPYHMGSLLVKAVRGMAGMRWVILSRTASSKKKILATYIDIYAENLTFYYALNTNSSYLK